MMLGSTFITIGQTYLSFGILNTGKYLLESYVLVSELGSGEVPLEKLQIDSTSLASCILPWQKINLSCKI